MIQTQRKVLFLIPTNSGIKGDSFLIAVPEAKQGNACLFNLSFLLPSFSAQYKLNDIRKFQKNTTLWKERIHKDRQRKSQVVAI